VSAADRAALEIAFTLAESAADAPVTVVTVGPPAADAGLREALAVGATRAVRIDAPADLPSALVAQALAGVARGSTWVLCGDASADRGSGAVPAFLAAELGAAQALGLVGVEASVAPLTVIRRLDGGRREVLAVPAPGVLSVEGSVARLRRASLPAEVAARTAPIEIAAGPVGAPERPEVVRPYRPRPRVLPIPTGDALARIRELTGAGGADGVGAGATTTETVVLEPAAAAARILATLRDWGYLDR
jgi:electron transfer flavoprotein beta subunit